MEEKTPDSQSAHEYDREKLLQNQYHAERQHDKLDTFLQAANDATIKSAENAVRTLALINSGAVVAILGFIGALVSKDTERTQQIVGILDSLCWFAFGVAASAGAACCAFLTHYTTSAGVSSKAKTWTHPYVDDTMKSRRWNWGRRLSFFLSYLFAFFSFGFFIWGVLSARDAISHLQ
jgi:branched-subunit amino acid permease